MCLLLIAMSSISLSRSLPAAISSPTISFSPLNCCFSVVIRSIICMDMLLYFQFVSWVSTCSFFAYQTFKLTCLICMHLWQLERSKDDGIEEFQRPSEEMGSMNCSNKKSDEVGTAATKDEGAAGVTAEEVVEELRKVRRQNTITHVLLSVLIVVTAVWQLSEFSFILEIKNKVQHPFRAIGGMIFRALGGNPDRSSRGKSSAPVIPHTDGHPQPLPPFKMPEIPHVELKPLPGNSGS